MGGSASPTTWLNAHSGVSPSEENPGCSAVPIAAEEGRLFCFDRVGEDPAADPGFLAGGFPDIEATNIAHAVGGAEGVLHAAAGGSHATLLVPITGKRGHSLGIVGLTFGKIPPDFDAVAVTGQILRSLSEQRQNDTRDARVRL